MKSAKKPTRQRPTAAKLKSWRVVMMRSRGQLLGYVEAADLKAAEAAAVKAFDLDSDPAVGAGAELIR
jgi:hypothetical protein